MWTAPESRANGRSHAATNELVESLSDIVFGTIRRMLGGSHRQNAEDVAQEIYVKILRSLDRFEPHRASLRTWVHAIARNHCLDVRRAPRLRTVSLDLRNDDDAPVFEPASPTRQRPLHQMLAAELRSEIDDAIRGLQPEFRRPLVMRHFEGMRYADIARALRVKEGTVKSRIHRARLALRNQLGSDQRGPRRTPSRLVTADSSGR